MSVEFWLWPELWHAPASDNAAKAAATRHVRSCIDPTLAIAHQLHLRRRRGAEQVEGVDVAGVDLHRRQGGDRLDSARRREGDGVVRRGSELEVGRGGSETDSRRLACEVHQRV